MNLYALFNIIFFVYAVDGQLKDNLDIPGSDFETRRINMIVDIIKINLKKNGWCTILCFGTLPDEFYKKLQNLSYPFAITNIDREDEDIEDVEPHHANTIVVNLEHIELYEQTIFKLISSPYWHPHSNTILYYHEQGQAVLAKLYFSLWYYKAINAIIIQYDDEQQALVISHYSPYITDDYKLDYFYGCWTKRRITIPISGFEDSLICEESCQNVSLQSTLRANNLGTCIGFSIITISYNASSVLTTLNLFRDKSTNLHGFPFRTYLTEVLPFLFIDVSRNGSITLRNRDGMIWTSIAKLMNFSMDLSPSVKVMKKQFNFELNIQQIFDLSHRKADLFLIPIYLFDLIIVEVDNTFPFKESGVCIVSHRAGFDTTILDAKKMHANQSVIAQFVICFLCIWVMYAIYQVVEKRSFSFDQIGKDLMNAFRNVLLISLCNPPRWRSFRIFLTISLWSFFVISFVSQAKVISVLTAVKRSKEVDTFEDVIDKEYPIYAMASPDLILPDTEERFRIINSRLIPELDLFECVSNMTYDRRRFCLIDCAVGRYLERNKLNEYGEQYLHVSRQDRMHGHYLSMIFAKHSPLTERFSKFMMTFFEAGLIKKWEQYRYADIKEEAPTRPLGMDDFKSLFNIYIYFVGFITMVFVLELFIFHGNKCLNYYLSRKNTVRSTEQGLSEA